jgi:hypothetical protein
VRNLIVRSGGLRTNRESVYKKSPWLRCLREDSDDFFRIYHVLVTECEPQGDLKGETTHSAFGAVRLDPICKIEYHTAYAAAQKIYLISAIGASFEETCSQFEGLEKVN